MDNIHSGSKKDIVRSHANTANDTSSSDATVSIAPPALQFKTKETTPEKDTNSDKGIDNTPFQFALADPGTPPVKRNSTSPPFQLKAEGEGKSETSSDSLANQPFQLSVDGEGSPSESPNLGSGETPPNNTGLPTQLKSGIENLSGFSLDDVQVHRNSDKPAQLQAHAYAQGTDIHLGPGQEKHLPHEAWHVVQQKQGRVQPTTQLKAFNINDDAGLEKEADVMGAKAMQMKVFQPENDLATSSGSSAVQLQSSEHGGSCGCSSCSGGKIQMKTSNTSFQLSSHDSGCECSSCSGGKIQMKRKGVVQKVQSEDQSYQEFYKTMLSTANNTLKDHRPSTTLGRFDAKLDVKKGALFITVKAFLDFGNGTNGAFPFISGKDWTKDQKDAWTQQFKTQTESAWSDKFNFTPKKEGFEKMTIRPIVKFVPVQRIDDAHFHHQVWQNSAGGTAIGRQQDDAADPSPVNVGNFKASDSQKGQTATGCKGIVQHESIRLKYLLEAYDVNPIKFDSKTNEIDDSSKAKIDAFVARLIATNKEGTVPVSLIAKWKDNKREKLKRSDAGSQRAANVKGYLESKLPNGQKVNPSSFNDDVSAAKEDYENTNHRGAKADKKEKYKEMKSASNHRQVSLAPDINHSEPVDEYSTLAHEFGHMLGNPDEYASYMNPVVLNDKINELVASGNEEDKLRAEDMMKKRSGAEKGGLNFEPQAAMHDLAQATGQDTPMFGSKNENIMSVGAKVLPVHYLTILEALSTITANTIKVGDWAINETASDAPEIESIDQDIGDALKYHPMLENANIADNQEEPSDFTDDDWE